MTVQVHELNATFLECPLGKQVTLDARQSLVWVVISLLNQTQFLTLVLVEPALHAVGLLETLEAQNQQLGVMFVRERREGDWGEPPTLQPMYSGGVDGYSLFSCDVWPILQVVMLPLLLGLQVESCETAQVLLAHCFVHSSSSSDSLPVVVSRVGPPVSLGLDISQDHVLNGDGQARNLRLDMHTVTTGEGYAHCHHGGGGGGGGGIQWACTLSPRGRGSVGTQPQGVGGWGDSVGMTPCRATGGGWVGGFGGHDTMQSNRGWVVGGFSRHDTMQSHRGWVGVGIQWACTQSRGWGYSVGMHTDTGGGWTHTMHTDIGGGGLPSMGCWPSSNAMLHSNAGGWCELCSGEFPLASCPRCRA